MQLKAFFLALGVCSAVFGGTCAAQSPFQPPRDGAPDPFAYLEDIHSERALAWVAHQNARTEARLEKDPRFEPLRAAALTILTSKDRLAMPHYLGRNLQSFWQDQSHIKGIWRVTTPTRFATATPHWLPLIDFDRLSKVEGKNWIFKGATCLAPDDRLCLVEMSDGGGDAVELREFDTHKRAFVPGGFRLPSGKQSVAWLDQNTLLVARDFGPGTLTHSGYAMTVRKLSRGASLAQAKEVFRGEPTDVQVSASVLRDGRGRVLDVLIDRGVAFFSSQWLRLKNDRSAQPLDLPDKISVHGQIGSELIIGLNEGWTRKPAQGAFAAGDLIAYNWRTGAATLIARPGSSQTFDDVAVTKSSVLVKYLDNVNGALAIYHKHGQGWSSKAVPLPKGLAVQIRAASDASDLAYVSTEGFLDPTTLLTLETTSGRLTRLRALTPLFDGSRDRVEQHFATSADGTKIPYFLVRPKNAPYDGTTPVQMFGYGGFLISETPSYRPELGKLWLERGGAYVLANIRGGGEFGPGWHDAALREHRQRAFDDFAAVAEDLIASKLTSARHLAIYGRSNGGVLTSVSMTQHPELFNGVVIESPLIDMLRYSHLSAGASWVAEYGDPDTPEDRAFISAYSAYTRLDGGATYPEPYITTNTEDDRVHPGHARKFAAALEALGKPYLYYENTFGGHANDADPELNARRWARHYVYLTEKLMD